MLSNEHSKQNVTVSSKQKLKTSVFNSKILEDEFIEIIILNGNILIIFMTNDYLNE